ncbi:MAG TPA: branched-chain amino acid ABC transporter permease [Acidimicrobiales bacterium]|jgi:branched-chain amino acid transport system permease protein|nr:branched-chain amino acid ABC transporter permease [Acidimicrobiales bacterium]
MSGLGAPILAVITRDDLLQTAFSGLAVGCKYALIALGFSVVFKATGVINFAQASLVLLGAYLTFNFSQTWDQNFYLSLVIAMGVGALIGVITEALVLRWLVGEPPAALIMVTIGLLFVLNNVVTAIWGPDNHNLGDPWGIKTRELAGVTVADRDLWTIGFAAVAMAAFFVFFRYSTLGLAMRAAAFDPEVAMAQGIPARRVHRVAWAIAGVVAALAGATLAAGAGQLSPATGALALVAFPAIILGGLDSPLGAVVGGIIIGLVQQFTALLAPEYFDWVGDSFERVSPYLVMIVILLIRPYGLFGTREVRRV